MSGNSNVRSLCESASVVYCLSWFSLMKPCFLVCLVIFYCQLLISLKSYLWEIHVFLQKGFAFSSARIWRNCQPGILKLSSLSDKNSGGDCCVSVLIAYCSDPLRALTIFPAVLVWVCRLSSSLSSCWVLWGSNLMWNGPKTEIWHLIDLEARMRSSKSSSAFQTKSRETVGQRQYLKRNG